MLVRVRQCDQCKRTRDPGALYYIVKLAVTRAHAEPGSTFVEVVALHDAHVELCSQACVVAYVQGALAGGERGA